MTLYVKAYSKHRIAYIPSWIRFDNGDSELTFDIKNWELSWREGIFGVSKTPLTLYTTPDGKETLCNDEYTLKLAKEAKHITIGVYPLIRRVTNIKWDVDEDKDESIDLPITIDIPRDIVDGFYNDNEDAISDYISNLTGYCHFGYTIEYVNENHDYNVSITQDMIEDDVLTECDCTLENGWDVMDFTFTPERMEAL